MVIRKGIYALITEFTKLSFAAALYWIWRERNSRQFQGTGISAEVLGLRVLDEVRSCLCSWRTLKPTDANWLMARDWRFSSSILSL